MNPWRTVATAESLTLRERAGEFLVQVDGRVLMSSRRHVSEDLLATVTLKGLGASARVLIGGLGFGYTLRAALDALAPGASVVVAEISAAIVGWNRAVLASLAGRPLDDARVSVEVDDVRERLVPGAFDAVLLDVDNGPFAVSRPENASLYTKEGVEKLLAALTPGGRLGVWSAGADQSFDRRLQEVGFTTSVHHVPAGGSEASHHVLFVATKLSSPT